MQLSYFRCAAVAVMTVLPVAFARQPAKRAAPSQAAKERPSAVPSGPSASTLQPAPEIRSLIKAFAGKWSTQEKYEPVFLTPNGGTGRGETIFRPGPGGFTLEEEYRAQTPAGPLFGLGVIWYDSAKGLQHLWCINIYPDGCEMFPPPPQPGPQWDGKKLVLHVETDQGGKKMIFHEVIRDITPTSYTQTGDVGESGAPLKRWFTIHATRVRNATASTRSSVSKPF